MVRNLRLLGSLLVVLVLLAACGEDDDAGTGARADVPTETAVVASPEVTSTAEATPTEPESTPTAAVEPATPTVDATATPSKAVEVTPPKAEASALKYERLTAWDAKWEGLGAMVLGFDGRLYIDDYVRKQLMVFGADGANQGTIAYPAWIPEKGLPRNELAVGPDGRLYLLEMSGPARVQVLEPDGTLVTEWGGTTGPDETTLFDAQAIAVAPDGHVFIACQGIGNGPSSRLLKFTSDGTFVAAWTRAGDYLFPGETHAMAIADDTLYIGASGYQVSQTVILQFDFDGNLVADPLVIGDQEAEDRIFPASFAIGPEGNLFMLDSFTREVIVMSAAGEELTRWTLEETEQRFPLVELAVDSDGRVYVADDANKAVFVYAPSDGDEAAVQADRTLAMIPAHAPCSTPVDVIGKGFEPGVTVALIEMSPNGGVTILAEVVAGTDGVVTAEVIPQAGQDCFAITELAGIPARIDAWAAGETVASTNFTVYSMELLAGLQLSAHEVTCDDVLTVSGLNFVPGTDAIVTVGVEGGHQPVVPGQAVPVDADGGFEATVDVSQFGPCQVGAFDEPQEYIIWAVTDRMKQDGAPNSYPSQRAMILLLPPVE